MQQLIKKPEMAGELRDYLEQRAGNGHRWVVYDADNPIGSRWDLHCFRDEIKTLEFEREYQQIFNWHVAVPIVDLINNLKEIEYSLKNKDMNRNVEEKFRQEATSLKVPKEMIEEAVSQMEKGIPYIKVKGQLPAQKGTKDLTIHVKLGGKYNNYFLNRYDLALSKAKPLEEGKSYMVISTDADGKKQFKKFNSPLEAIENFKKREGDAELAIGKSVKDNMQLATMKDGKVDYVTKDFQAVYYSPPLTNSVYVENGVGFNVIQAGNMLEGGSAFRDDLVSRLGNQYEAWNIYLFNEPRDKYGNLKVKQFGEGYGFNLKTDLQNYRVKDFEIPEKFEAIMNQMKDGERPIVTAVNDKGEEMTVRIQAMPRFGNNNFFQLNGKPENREQFQKVVKQKDKDLSVGQKNELTM